MKILVTGESGQLGHDVCIELSKRGIENFGPSPEEFDITDENAVKRVMDEYRPDAVIHCAAYTAVDKAEDDTDVCWKVNVDGTANIAKVCRRQNIKMLYISTDYVFAGDGEKPYKPDDAYAPCNAYGYTKLGGELAVKALLEKFFIIRISWVFGKNGNNFIKTMLRLCETHDTLTVVNDQIGSPTYTYDLAKLICDMIVSEKYGVYHATNGGEFISWSDFAKEIFRQAGKNVNVIPVTTKQYGVSKAKRPKNSRMDKSKLTDNGFEELPDWKDALSRYLKEISE